MDDYSEGRLGVGSAGPARRLREASVLVGPSLEETSRGGTGTKY